MLVLLVHGSVGSGVVVIYSTRVLHIGGVVVDAVIIVVVALYGNYVGGCVDVCVTVGVGVG